MKDLETLNRLISINEQILALQDRIKKLESDKPMFLIDLKKTNQRKLAELIGQLTNRLEALEKEGKSLLL